MTDLTPNDLSHLSDEEFNALCPQGYHAPGPATALSPAAQAVLEALYMEVLNGPQQLMARAHAAAALRAAADQTVPREEWPDQSIGFADWNLATERCEQRKNIRASLLAIAAELEACIAWFDKSIPGYELVADRIRAARRPKPLSLKEQALALIDLIQGNKKPWDIKDLDVVRRALEALPND
jgi:hypothetical protein